MLSNSANQELLSRLVNLFKYLGENELDNFHQSSDYMIAGGRGYKRLKLQHAFLLSVLIISSSPDP